MSKRWLEFATVMVSFSQVIDYYFLLSANFRLVCQVTVKFFPAIQKHMSTCEKVGTPKFMNENPNEKVVLHVNI